MSLLLCGGGAGTSEGVLEPRDYIEQIERRASSLSNPHLCLHRQHVNYPHGAAGELTDSSNAINKLLVSHSGNSSRPSAHTCNN